jgi:hypothetical protein
MKPLLLVLHILVILSTVWYAISARSTRHELTRTMIRLHYTRGFVDGLHLANCMLVYGHPRADCEAQYDHQDTYADTQP